MKKYLKYIQVIVGIILGVYGCSIQFNFISNVGNGLAFIILGICILIIGIYNFKK